MDSCFTRSYIEEQLLNAYHGHNWRTYGDFAVFLGGECEMMRVKRQEGSVSPLYCRCDSTKTTRNNIFLKKKRQSMPPRTAGRAFQLCIKKIFFSTYFWVSFSVDGGIPPPHTRKHIDDGVLFFVLHNILFFLLLYYLATALGHSWLSALTLYYYWVLIIESEKRTKTQRVLAMRNINILKTSVPQYIMLNK